MSSSLKRGPTKRHDPRSRVIRYKAIKPAGPRAHPLVKKLYELMIEQQISVVMMSERTGINTNTIFGWRHYHPSLVLLEACYNVLGLTLQPVEKKDG